MRPGRSFDCFKTQPVVIAICMFNSNRVNFVTAILICPAKNDLISLFFNHFIMIIELGTYIAMLIIKLIEQLEFWYRY